MIAPTDPPVQTCRGCGATEPRDGEDDYEAWAESFIDRLCPECQYAAECVADERREERLSRRGWGW